MDETILQAQAERAALRIILSNIVAQLAAMEADSVGRRARLDKMKDQGRRAAEQSMNHVPGTDRGRLVDEVIQNLDDFYKSITIT